MALVQSAPLGASVSLVMNRNTPGASCSAKFGSCPLLRDTLKIHAPKLPSFFENRNLATCIWAISFLIVLLAASPTLVTAFFPMAPRHPASSNAPMTPHSAAIILILTTGTRVLITGFAIPSCTDLSIGARVRALTGSRPRDVRRCARAVSHHKQDTIHRFACATG